VLAGLLTANTRDLAFTVRNLINASSTVDILCERDHPFACIRGSGVHFIVSHLHCAELVTNVEVVRPPAIVTLHIANTSLLASSTVLDIAHCGKLSVRVWMLDGLAWTHHSQRPSTATFLPAPCQCTHQIMPNGRQSPISSLHANMPRVISFSTRLCLASRNFD